jgi:hypothetical protein
LGGIVSGIAEEAAAVLIVETAFAPWKAAVNEEE